MSNYPAGVTGNELAIAGPDAEYSDYKECDTIIQATIPQGGVYSDSSIVEDVEVECDFEGEVDCWAYDGIEHWECPKCHTEHEVDLADYADPDREYDEMRERRLFD